MDDFFKREFCQEGFSGKNDIPEKDFEESKNCIDHLMCNSEEKAVNNNVCHKTLMSYDCDICGKVFSKRSKLAAHIRYHKKEIEADKGKRYVCDICQKEFVQRRSLKRHFRRHFRPYKCEICPKSYSRKSALRRHSFIHTRGKRKKKVEKFVCSACEETFSTQAEKDLHLRTHFRKKEYNCVVCAINFTRQSDLKDHFLIHTGEIPFKCEECGLTFSRKTDFYYHLSSHNTEKRFKCDKCGKAYQFKRWFIKHLRTHGVSFVCSVCEKEFLTQQNLEVHFRKHSQENPYECPFCGKPCYRNYDLKRHMQSHIKVNPSSSIKDEKSMTE